MKLDIRHFELVNAIQEGGTLSAAARKLGVTQAAVSTSLKSLEKTIGGKLFENSDNGLVPTKLADIFLSRSQKIRAPIEQIFTDIENIKRGRHSQLNVGVGFYPPFLSLFGSLANLHSAMNQITFNIVERDWRDIMLAISSDTIDFGIIDVSIAETSTEFNFKRLPRHICSIVVNKKHPLTKFNTVEIDDLLDFPYCGPHPSRWAIDHAGIGAKIFGMPDKDYGRISSSFNVHTMSTAVSLISSTNAFGILPSVLFEPCDFLPHSSWFSENYIQLNVKDLDWLKTNYGIVWRRDRELNDSDRQFMDILEKLEEKIFLLEK